MGWGGAAMRYTFKRQTSLHHQSLGLFQASLVIILANARDYKYKLLPLQKALPSLKYSKNGRFW